MAKMNQVQFQEGMSLDQFMALYGEQEQCEEALERRRWPGGFTCRHCGRRQHDIVWQGKAKTFQCCTCHCQSTLTGGTIFHSSKLPLTKWFQAMYFLIQAKNNVSALELMRLIGVCYRSAWRVKHKLLEVMTQREAGRQLEGRVEVDDAYLGGARPGGKRRRGSPNKVPFIAAVQTDADEWPELAVFSQVKTFGRADVQAWASVHLAASCVVVSDGLDCFTAVTSAGASHVPEVVGTQRKSSAMPCFKWINIVLGNLKTATSGTYHAFNFRKYGHRYLAEAQYRFNRCFDLSAILQRFLYAAEAIGRRTEASLRLLSRRPKITVKVP